MSEDLDGLADDLAQHETDAGPTNHFESVDEFVYWLAKVYARPVQAQLQHFRWCSRWWEHDEAVSRLEALWKAFETLRLDPGTGAAVWWRDFADPTMNALCSADGTFKACSPEGHKVPPDLPLMPVPGNYFGDQPGPTP